MSNRSNRTKKHHYIPAFYLAGFTESGSKDGRLFVFDQGKIESWPSKPENAGYQRDFYAVDLGPDVDPAVFETEVLARVESECSRVVRETIASQTLPVRAEFNVLLNFVAVMATRTPRTRQLMSHVANHTVKSAVKAAVATVDGWKEFRMCCESSGEKMSDAEAEQMRQFILSGEYDVDLDQTSHVQKIGELVDAMLPLIAKRQWSLGVAAPGMPDLVCSDVPVSAAPTDEFEEDEELHLSNRHTLLMMPLDRRTVLFGEYKSRPPKVVINELGILTVNAMTIAEARQVYSTEEDFAYLGSNNRLQKRNDLMESLRRRNGKYSSLKEGFDQWIQTRGQATA